MCWPEVELKVKSSHSHIIRNESPQSDAVSFWSPPEFDDQPAAGMFGELDQPGLGEGQKKSLKALMSEERDRLLKIFKVEEKDKGTFDRAQLHSSVLPTRHQEDVHSWEPTTISFLPFGMEMVEDEPEPVIEIIEEDEPEKIRQDEFLHFKEEAERIVNEAKAQAASMVAEAENQVEQIRTTAYQEGYEQARQEGSKLLASAQTVVEETHQWREAVLGQSEKSIISMLQMIANKLFGDGFVLDADLVERMVVRAISEASRLGNLRVYLNPLDEEKLVDLWQESELVVNGQKISLISSPNIDPGGCFIEGEFGSVDSRIGMQLELIQSEIQHLLFSNEETVS